MVSWVWGLSGTRTRRAAWPRWLRGSGVRPFAARNPNSQELAA